MLRCPGGSLALLGGGCQMMCQMMFGANYSRTPTEAGLALLEDVSIIPASGFSWVECCQSGAGATKLTPEFVAYLFWYLVPLIDQLWKVMEGVENSGNRSHYLKLGAFSLAELVDLVHAREEQFEGSLTADDTQAEINNTPVRSRDLQNLNNCIPGQGDSMSRGLSSRSKKGSHGSSIARWSEEAQEEGTTLTGNRPKT